MKIHWKWGILSALVMTLLSLYPQLDILVRERGHWAGSYAYIDTDEVAYSAYLQAIIDGRPRRCNPYSGVDPAGGQPSTESLFSIQFAAAYLVAIPARLLHLSASSVFILLIPLVSAASALVLYWFLVQVTGHSRIAAAGVLIVLCLPTLVSAQGPIGLLYWSPHGWSYLTFQRRYLPAIPFPVFLILFGVVWKLLNKTDTCVIRSLAVGISIAFLMYSYFFLWTAALAWLTCIGILWLIARPAERRRTLLVVAIIYGIVFTALVPFVILLSKRSAEMDSVQALTLSRIPDVTRPSELLSTALLVVLLLLIRFKRLRLSDPAVLFALSLLASPLIIFNQQVITGRELQAFHYEEFVTSYTFLIALVICWQVFSKNKLIPNSAASRTVTLAMSAFSILYAGIIVVSLSQAALDDNLTREQNVRVMARLKELPNPNSGMVMFLNPRLGDSLPTFSPVPQLWAAHMAVFPGVRPIEVRERFYQYLYYSDVTPLSLHESLMAKNYMISSALFGFEREAEHLTQQFKPITATDIADETRSYEKYVTAFGRSDAARYPLTYFITCVDSPNANIERWYEKESAEGIGECVIYQLKLR